MKSNLGKEARDKVTGFTGIITGHCEYLTGCSQYGIQPKVDKEGKVPDTRWVDVNRCEIVGDGVEVANVSDIKNPGGPQSTPNGSSL